MQRSSSSLESAFRTRGWRIAGVHHPSPLRAQHGKPVLLVVNTEQILGLMMKTREIFKHVIN